MSTQGSPISDRDYWERQYRDDRPTELSLEGFPNRSNRLIVEKLTPLVQRAGSVLEIGAGGSAWLPYFAGRYRDERYVGLDYTEQGCASLRKAVAGKGLEAEVIQADMFEPPEHLLGRFGLVMSFGVVEHFLDLSVTMRAIGRFCSPGGAIFTLIPNLSGALGHLTRYLNRQVYDMHVPHDRETFRAGHVAAGLEVREVGYLGSSNFGVLSSTVSRPGLKFELYRWLTRVSKAGFLFEDRIAPLPASRYFSPYLYCVAARAAPP